MAGLPTVILRPTCLPGYSLPVMARLFCVLLLILYPAFAKSADSELELQALAQERGMLTLELNQYKKTVELLHTDTTPAQRSSNPAVRQLALEIVKIKERLIVVTERELALLQEQISIARQLTHTEQETAGASEGMESKPLREPNYTHSLASEQEHVERLHTLLASYYTELKEAAHTLPSESELAKRAAARLDAQKLSHIPFSADKIHLNGAEASTALSEITGRLSDPGIPESRRDTAPICGIRTELFGSLIASERRSLKPVGKSHYVARIRLQPGTTTLRIKDDRWEIQLPQNASARDYLITLYTPPNSHPELHLFAIDELLAEQHPHIPAWLPEDINLASRPG